MYMYYYILYVYIYIRPLKNEVLIFGASLGFSHYFIHLMPIGTILNKINQYSRSAASALKFLCFGTYVNIRGNVDLYIRVVLFVQLCENARSHPPIRFSF